VSKHLILPFPIPLLMYVFAINVTGVEEKSFGKAANIDNDISNLCVSPSAGSQNLLEGFPFNLEKLDTDLISNLGPQAQWIQVL